MLFLLARHFFLALSAGYDLRITPWAWSRPPLRKPTPWLGPVYVTRAEMHKASNSDAVFWLSALVKISLLSSVFRGWKPLFRRRLLFQKQGVFASNCKMKVLRKIHDTLFLSSHSPVGICFSENRKKWSICTMNIGQLDLQRGLQCCWRASIFYLSIQISIKGLWLLRYSKLKPALCFLVQNSNKLWSVLWTSVTHKSEFPYCF